MNRLTAVFLVPALLLAFARCAPAQASTPSAASAARPIAVTLAPVTRAELARPVRGVGLLASKREVKLAFKVGGVVRQVLVEEGQAVARGQVLASLDPREIDAQVVLAQNGADKAQRDLERAERLQREEVASVQQLQDATTAREVARAQLDVARFNQAHAVLRAPFAGRVLRRTAEPEELLAPGVPALVLSSGESGWVVRLGVTDLDRLTLHEGDPASVRIQALGGSLAAHVTELASAASHPAGTFEVELTLDTPPPGLASGLVASADILPSARRPYRLVPVQALVEGHGLSAKVFTVEGSAAHQVGVELAWLSGAEAVVRSGLDGVDAVVAAGAGWLTEGAPVLVKPVAP
jgi:RND family efflux transporter MFP subunit